MKKNDDFKSFIQNDDASHYIPGISRNILSRVHADLNPSAYFVFSKLLIIHVFSALVTLSMCPQFGVRLLGEGMGLMHTFMILGPFGCLVACGMFFTGTSVFIASG